MFDYIEVYYNRQRLQRIYLSIRTEILQITMIEVTTLSEMTIDGKLALGPGHSSKDLFKFYTDDLRVWFHEQRANADAIMVGAGTVLMDDPQLTVRHVNGRNPLRVIPSSTGHLPLDARVLNDGLPTLVALSHSASMEARQRLEKKQQVELITCGGLIVDLTALMIALEKRDVRRLIVEGGSRLLHSFFSAGLVTRLIIKHIPVIAGRADAPGFLASTNGSHVPMSRWRLDEWFEKGGVAVSVYSERPQ